MESQDQYTVDYSFGYAKTDAGLDPLVGDATGATYQAVADIKWNKLQLTALGPWLYHPRRKLLSRRPLPHRICRHCFYHDNHLCCART